VAKSIILNSKMVKKFIKITTFSSFFEKIILKVMKIHPPQKKKKKKNIDHDSTNKTQVKY
jgi:hypothetical protein